MDTTKNQCSCLFFYRPQFVELLAKLTRHKLTICGIILFLLTILGNRGYAQIDTSDIFELDKNHHLKLKPAIEKRINKVIEPIVRKRVQAYQIENASDLRYLEDSIRREEIRFAEDTIRISEFMSEYYGSYSEATTTMGMNWGESTRLDMYDALLNRFYKKALSVLKPEMRAKLVESQKAWLNYYLNDKVFISQLNDFGNHNSYLYGWGHYLDMLEKRVLFLKQICQREFNGTDTYLR